MRLLEVAEEKRPSTHIRLTPLTHMRLKVLAEIEGRKMNMIVERVLNSYLATEHPEIARISSVGELSSPKLSSPSAQADERKNSGLGKNRKK